MSKTYNLRSTDGSANWLSAAFELDMDSGTSASQAAATTLTASLVTVAGWTTDPGEPNVADWPAASVGDPYKMVVDVTAMGANVALSNTDSGFYRLNSLATLVAQSISGTWDSTVGTGLKTMEHTSWNPFAGVAEDRFGVLVSATTSNTMMDNGLTLGSLNTGTVYAQGPWSTGPSTTTLTPTPIVADLAVPAPTLGLSLALSPASVFLDLAVPVASVAVVPPATVLSLTPVLVDLGLAAPSLGLALGLVPGAVPVDLGVPLPSIGLGALSLAASPVATLLGVPVHTVSASAGETDLLASPVLLDLGSLGGSLGLSLSIASQPIAADLALAAPSLGLSLTLSPAAPILDLSISSSVVSTALLLSSAPVLLDLGTLGGTVSAGALGTDVVATPVVLDLSVLAGVLGGSLGLSASPVVLTLGSTPGQIGQVLALSAVPVSQSLGILGGSVSPGALALLASPVSLGLRLTHLGGQLGPLLIVSGSDHALILELLAYWEAYDAAPNEEARGLLLRDWLLSHGGRLRWNDGFWELKGGLRPVRPQL